MGTPTRHWLCDCGQINIIVKQYCRGCAAPRPRDPIYAEIDEKERKRALAAPPTKLLVLEEDAKPKFKFRENKKEEIEKTYLPFGQEEGYNRKTFKAWELAQPSRRKQKKNK